LSIAFPPNKKKPFANNYIVPQSRLPVKRILTAKGGSPPKSRDFGETSPRVGMKSANRA
jgi:hypothetical protein